MKTGKSFRIRDGSGDYGCPNRECWLKHFTRHKPGQLKCQTCGVDLEWEYLMPKDIIQEHLDTVVNRVWNHWGKAETEKEEVFNAALGLAGECGEVCDILKKMAFHEDRDGREIHLLKELGDVYFYLAKIQELFGFTTAEVLGMNKTKLFERFNVID